MCRFFALFGVLPPIYCSFLCLFVCINYNICKHSYADLTNLSRPCILTTRAGFSVDQSFGSYDVSAPCLARLCYNPIVSKTVRHMIIHRARCLHQRIANRTANKSKFRFFEFFTHSIESFRRRRNIRHRFSCTVDRYVIYETPNILRERAIRGNIFLHSNCIFTHTAYLQTIAHNFRVLQNFF